MITPDTPTPGGEPSDAEIIKIAETLGKHEPGVCNYDSWGPLGYRLDDNGQYTIPTLPRNVLPFARALLSRFGTRPAAEPVPNSTTWVDGTPKPPRLDGETWGEYIARVSAAEPTGFPPRILALLEEVAKGPYEDGQGEPLEADARAALAWLAGQPSTAQADKSAAPAEPAGWQQRTYWEDGASNEPGWGAWLQCTKPTDEQLTREKNLGIKREYRALAVIDPSPAPQAQQEAPDHE